MGMSMLYVEPWMLKMASHLDGLIQGQCTCGENTRWNGIFICQMPSEVQQGGVCCPGCGGKVQQVYMQGADQHDQLPSAFSLSSWHNFKNYYVKLMLMLINVVLTNATIHHFMKNCCPPLLLHDATIVSFVLCIASHNDISYSAVAKEDTTNSNASSSSMLPFSSD